MDCSSSIMDIIRCVLVITSLNAVCLGLEQMTNATNTCRLVFTAQEMTDVFSDTCAPLTFPCNERGLLPVPGDCGQYFTCSDRQVFQCPCAPGNEYDVATKTCIDQYYANCTCANGFLPSTTPTTPTVKVTESGSESRNTGAIVGGVIGALVVVGLVVGVIVFVICFRKRSPDHAEDVPTKRPAGSFQYDNANYGAQDSVIDGVYSIIDDTELGGDHGRSLPPVPTEAANADKLPVRSAQETEEQSDEDEEQEQSDEDEEQEQSEGSKEGPVYDNTFQ